MNLKFTASQPVVWILSITADQFAVCTSENHSVVVATLCFVTYKTCFINKSALRVLVAVLICALILNLINGSV